MKRQGVNKISVEFHSYKAANAIINNEQIAQKGYKTYIPWGMKTCRGVVKGIATHLTEEDILRYTKSSKNVVQVRRIKRKELEKIHGDKEQLVYVNTGTVVFTFKGKVIPKEVHVCLLNLEVDIYINPVIQCYRCLRFGHTKQQCRSRTGRCDKCGELNHYISECKEQQSTCFFCQDNHDATSKNCKEYQTQKNIKELMAYENISHYDAWNKCKQSKIQRNNINFPELPKTKEIFNNDIDVTQRRAHATQSNKIHMKFSQIVKRKRHPEIEEGYNKIEHQNCLIKYPKVSQNILTTAQYTQHLETNTQPEIIQIENIINKETITKDDKAIMLIILKELQTKLNNGKNNQSNNDDRKKGNDQNDTSFNLF